MYLCCLLPQVEAASPAAADGLRAAALLAPEAIPLELFTAGASELGPHLAQTLADAPDDPLQLAEVLAPLTRYSLIQRDVAERTFSLHPLVQAVQRAALAPADRAEWQARTLRAMNRVFPDVQFETWPLCARLLPHARAVIERLGASPQDAEGAGRLLNQVAFYLHEQAEPLLKRSLALCEQALGPEHPDVARSLNNLAMLYSAPKTFVEPILANVQVGPAS